MITIAITGSGSLIGQAIIKSIKSSSFRNSRLIGVDYFPNTIGSYWTNENHILPDILDKNIKEEYWLEKIIQIIKSNNIDIVFIGVDFELFLFAKYKKDIEQSTNCIILVSDLDAIEIADDKYLTYKFLKQNNLYYPHTFLAKNYSNAIEEGVIKFPLIVKPRIGYRSVDVYIVNSIDELLNKINKVKNPIIQEYIGSKYSEFTCGVIAFNGEVKESIVLKRDLKDGNTSTTYLKYDYPIIIKEYIENVSRKFNQFGACNFQLRMGENQIPKIFEINARHSGTTYIRSLYGFNEIEYILEYLINKKEITFKIKEGIVKRYFDEFFIKDTK